MDGEQLLSWSFLSFQASPFLVLWLKIVGFFFLAGGRGGLFMPASVGVSGLLVSPTPNWTYMRQIKRNKKCKKGNYHAMYWVLKFLPNLLPLSFRVSSFFLMFALYNIQSFWLCIVAWIGESIFIPFYPRTGSLQFIFRLLTLSYSVIMLTSFINLTFCTFSSIIYIHILWHLLIMNIWFLPLHFLYCSIFFLSHYTA